MATKKPAAKKATAKPAAKPAAKKTTAKTTAKAAPAKKATAKTDNTALEAALAEIEELKAEVKRLKVELAKAGKSETQKEDKRKSKSKDPFEGLMITVCAGMFSQQYYVKRTIHPDGDRRRKEITVFSKRSHIVTISKEYQICKYPVTQAQWKAIMGEGFNMSEFRGDDLPVTNISYERILQFIEKLNKLTGKKYRLPTEAEWTWAAMGANKDNDQGTYAGCNNDEDLGLYAWYDKNSGGTTHPVGQKKPNELGLYDMSGNVGECCQDKFKYDLGENGAVDPIVEKGDLYWFVSKGGSFCSSSFKCQIQRDCTSDKYSVEFFDYNKRCGFRLAL